MTSSLPRYSNGVSSAFAANVTAGYGFDSTPEWPILIKTERTDCSGIVLPSSRESAASTAYLFLHYFAEHVIKMTHPDYKKGLVTNSWGRWNHSRVSSKSSPSPFLCPLLRPSSFLFLSLRFFISSFLLSSLFKYSWCKLVQYSISVSVSRSHFLSVYIKNVWTRHPTKDRPPCVFLDTRPKYHFTNSFHKLS